MKREGRGAGTHEPRSSYSPHLRTALVLTGTGSAGAYHAGVLRALEEAGIKIDLVAGRGIGVATAMYAAIGGAHRLWESGGVWRGPNLERFYRWRPALRVAGIAAVAALAALLVPLALLAAGLIVSTAGFVLQLASVEAGGAMLTGYARVLEQLFRPEALPTVLPRLVTLGVVVAIGALVAAGLGARMHRRSRRERSWWWWALVGAPWSRTHVVQTFRRGLWGLIRGAVPVAEPDRRELGRRYADLLAESLGQPGFRELVTVVHDLDARRDLVFALLADGPRGRFFPPVGQEPARRAETFDLRGLGRDHALDALPAGLSLPVLTEPHLMRLSPEGFWRGETHRLCDRPGATTRLLEEVAAAGAAQAIVVAPCSELVAPHGLAARRGDLRARAGDYLAAADVAALDDGVRTVSAQFDNVFVIRPMHSAVGPFDFGGAYDERSDRFQPLSELIDRGYEDAYRQFIDPIVGASGDRLVSSAT